MSSKRNGGAHGAKKKRNKTYKPYQPKHGVMAGGMIALAENQERVGQVAAFIENHDKPYSEDDLSDLARTYWLAFDQLKMGAATEEIWSTVCASINMATLLCERGIGEEHLPVMSLALDAMFSAQQRGERVGAYRLDGDGLRAVTEALQIHDEQMRHVTPIDIMRADDERIRRERDGEIRTAKGSLH